ncbi:uncharacterized protein LOC127867791 isoform X1 [Dreissena polymorpha]|uniref:uncharacterized protein LOC127867791 isoform X1 n=1 Tax=Dreissena polymorpha TaxID=45954 RepID=UPI0022656B59|nr:uncharacterized protein LOC127867791 isoform X1 [Dreissena polymorpha]
MAILLALAYIYLGIAGLIAAAPTSTPVSRCTSPTVDNGLVQCSSNKQELLCVIVCEKGYAFETGAREIQKSCDNTTGIWSPSAGFPDCVPGMCMGRLLTLVNDSDLSASSQFLGSRTLQTGPDRARLDAQVEASGLHVYAGGWKANLDSLDQYVQVEFNATMRVRGVVTQGRAVLDGDPANEYVTQYRLLYSDDGKAWRPYSSLKVSDQFLSGNHDRDTPNVNMLDCPFDARFVRINPLAWHEHIALRFDLLGCESDGFAPACVTPTTRTTMLTTTVTLDPNIVNKDPTTTSILTSTTVQRPNMCTALPPSSHGIMHCEQQTGSLVCVATCDEHYKFESNDLVIKRVCNQATGVWLGGPGIPKCIYNSAPTPLPPTNNYTNGCVTLKNECRQAGNGDFQACGGCHFFASCSEGYLYIRACPEQLLFDAISGVCDYNSRSCPNN